jgi:hypothetical protein
MRPPGDIASLGWRRVRDCKRYDLRLRLLPRDRSARTEQEAEAKHHVSTDARVTVADARRRCPGHAQAASGLGEADGAEVVVQERLRVRLSHIFPIARAVAAAGIPRHLAMSVAPATLNTGSRVATVSTQLVVRQPRHRQGALGQELARASVAGKFDVRCDMTATDLLVQPQVIAEPDELDLRWRAAFMGTDYRPLESWDELDLLLMHIGMPGFGFLIVERLTRDRFVQAMGDTGALIIEVCGNAGTWHPDVWRLRRDTPLPHAALDGQLWDGGMDARCLFTAAEAAVVFREWLVGGSVLGVELESVQY